MVKIIAHYECKENHLIDFLLQDIYNEQLICKLRKIFQSCEKKTHRIHFGLRYKTEKMFNQLIGNLESISGTGTSTIHCTVL